MYENVFQAGASYTRQQVKATVGAEPGRGGNWDTGYHRHGGTVFVFSTIGVPARTGHDYGDRWLPDRTFEWYGKTRSRVGQPLIEFMTDPQSSVLLFIREQDRDPFTFAGRIKAAKVFDEQPVRVIWCRV